MSAYDYQACGLLLPLNASNGSTEFLDWSPTEKMITVNEGPVASNEQAKFYETSAYFDGVGDALIVESFPLTTEDFYFAAWVFISTLTEDKFIFSKYNAIANKRSLRISVNVNRILWVATYASGFNDPRSNLYSSSPLPVGEWFHLEVSKIDGMGRIFINGVLDSSGALGDVFASTVPYICGATDDIAAFRFHGYLQDVIFSATAAGHAENFTAPGPLIRPLSGTVVDLQSIAPPTVTLFTWQTLRLHAKGRPGADRVWSFDVPDGAQYGAYYLSQDNRCSPVIHGPYTAE